MWCLVTPCLGISRACACSTPTLFARRTDLETSSPCARPQMPSKRRWAPLFGGEHKQVTKGLDENSSFSISSEQHWNLKLRRSLLVTLRLVTRSTSIRNVSLASFYTVSNTRSPPPSRLALLVAVTRISLPSRHSATTMWARL